MATSMNPVELYNDPSLDGLIGQNNTADGYRSNRRRYSGPERRQDSDQASIPPRPPPAPEVPRGPPISYRGTGQADPSIMQRSFSQRAKGRPFAKEAFADVDSYPVIDSVAARQPTPEVYEKDVERAVRTKPLPADHLRVNTSDLNGGGSAKALRREKNAGLDSSPNHSNARSRPRQISDPVRHGEEPASAVSGLGPFRDASNVPGDQRRDWAPDRSPLQKLEVKLNDISREEKRARVQEAEMASRERAARRNAQQARQRTSTQDSAAPVKRTSAKRDGESGQDVPTIGDAGSTQRHRLQHSTTLDGRRPNAQRLSDEGHRGFDYATAGEPGVTPTKQSTRAASKAREDDQSAYHTSTEPPRRTDYPDSTRPSRVQSRRQSAAQAPSAVSKLPKPARDVSVRPSQSSTRPDFNAETELTEQERSASHRAALDRLTGPAPPPAATTRNASRKLQKPLPAEPLANQSTAAPGWEARPIPRGVSDDRGMDSGPPRQDHPPVGLGLQSSPHPSSPRSPPGKVDVTRQRQRTSSVSFKEPVIQGPVDEWENAGTARLTLADFATDSAIENDKKTPWWEQTPTSSGGRRRSRGTKTLDASAFASDGPIDDRTPEFWPKLYLMCGPLLRYTGMKKIASENGKEDREIWRGSVMIVTRDSSSSYDVPPTLRLFSQPKRLLPPPPTELTGEDLAPEYVDPIAGLTKLSRKGRPLYVRPIDHLEEGKDLSQIENDDGLFESSPSPLDVNGGKNATAATTNKRTLDTDGERLGRYREVVGARLYADPDRDVTFWRFNLEIELDTEQRHIAYRINRAPAIGFWVPGRGQTMNMMFHSCNGFSLSVHPDDFSGPDPLWRDVLNTHQTRPFHVMIGGGDQLYNDRVMLETKHFGEWTKLRNPQHKHHAPFTNEMKEELETFYLHRYAMWFSQGLFSMANSQIPMVNIWDDHDIIDGFGSYPHHFMESPVFSGLGNVAFKYYLLFQHQSVPEETPAHEPSWILGYQPGPYITQLSRNVFLRMGKHVAFLGIDCRTERMRDEIMTLDTLDLILDRCRKELVEGETKHLLILLGVPIAYPRLVWLENVLTSRIMDPVKALGRAGVLKGGFLNKFDGGVEILDDLDDHWTATHHKAERNELIKELQDLAAEKSVRITILGGDVHLAAIGQFFSNPKLRIPKDKDHRYMPNVISSAIVNTPPSDMLADILNKRNKTHHLDKYTDENMIPIFTHDVDHKKRNNKHMLPRRNWCSIREYMPGSTPLPTPPTTPSERGSDGEEGEEAAHPGSSHRRFSFSKDAVNPRALLRRLSSSQNAPPSSYRDAGDPGPNHIRSASYDGVQRRANDPSFAHDSNPADSGRASADPPAPPPNRRASSYDHTSSGAPVRPGPFQRRLTNLSEKAAHKGNVPALDADANEIDADDHVNLEGGLDILLNVEIDQKDASGITTPYRLLVPALWYDGSSDREKLDQASDVHRKPTLLKRIGFGAGRRSQQAASSQGAGNWGQEASDGESYSGSEDVQKAPPRRRFSLFGSRKPKKQESYSDSESDHDEHQHQPHPPFQQPLPNRGVSAGQPPHPLPTTGPPHSDQLYDTENRPPAHHPTQRVPVPAPTPSVRRSLTITSQPRPGNSNLRDTRDSSDSYSVPHPSFQAPASTARRPSLSPAQLNNPLPPLPTDATPPPRRRLSKQERLLGISSEQDSFPEPQQQSLRGNGVVGKKYEYSPSSAPPPSAYLRGYSGVEAYKEPKARRTWSLRAAKDWFDGGRNQ